MIRNVWLVCGGVWLGCSAVWAGATIDEDSSLARVNDALRQESATAGATDRRAILNNVLGDEGHSAARWQSGYVKHSQGWQSWEESPVNDPVLLHNYQQRRNEAGADAADQLKLADWCERAGLKDQERVHLMRALRTGKAENPRQILKRLGYRQVGSSWFTEAELAAAARQFASQWKDWKRLSPQLDKLAAQLVGKPRLREKAQAELCALAGPDNALILEQFLASRHEIAGQAVVEALTSVKSYRASQSLGRIAVVTPWQSVQASAIEELRQRPWEEFVPAVLELMHQPLNLEVQTRVRPDMALGRRPQLEWQFVWSREGRASVDVAVTRLLYRGATQLFRTPDGRTQAPLDAEMIVHADRIALSDLVYQTLSNAESLDDSTHRLNQQAGVVLSQVTDLPADDRPDQWWGWWDREIIDSPATEPKSTTVVSVDVQVFGTAALPRGGCSCLIAGTPVWTETGFHPIEEIRIGDRVLSKNIETGELKYQPVLHTTHRPGATVSELQIGDETIAASLGHNFWISGRGWTRTNQLEDGMPAHTPTGTVSTEIKDGTRTADVYNLVVDEFHTYFVGKAMLLGHDVIVPAPTDIRVPGLAPNLTALK